MSATILIVGADASSRELMVYLLESRGYRVVCANEEHAATAVAAETPDLVLHATASGTGPGGVDDANRILQPIDPSAFAAKVEALLKRR